MKTVTIQIGNSDDKLTQKEWSEFVKHIGSFVGYYASEIYFAGFSHADASWQNAAWVVSIMPERMDDLKKSLSAIRERHKQDSLACTEGETAFI